MKIKNKLGEENSSMGAIIGLIMFAVGFLAVLYIIFILQPWKITEQEICHNSVVMKSSAINVNNLLKNTVPLNCKTQSVCISEDGTCEKLTSPEIKKVGEEKNEVYQVLADQLANCWWMFGEGKVDYVGKEVFAGKLYCSLCSQIVFDDSVKMFTDVERGVVNRQINNREFYDYLKNKRMYETAGDIRTYWDYLYEGSSPKEMETAIKQKDNSYTLGTINLDKQYYIAMGIIDKTSVEPWMAAVGGGIVAPIVVAAVIGTGPLGIFVLAAAAGGAAVTGGGAAAGQYVGQMIVGESGQQYLRPTIIEANSKEYESLKCEDVKTLT